MDAIPGHGLPPIAESHAAGLIFNVMRFSLHDGPGIRTTVFLKGCPLHCWWCHNPESQSPLPDHMYAPTRCIGCRDCIHACRLNALRWEDGPRRDDTRCERCGDCATACPAEAQQLVGRWMSVPRLLNDVLRDRVFHEESCGGITFSGGEPLSQPDFLEAALAACQREGLHTTVDTCGFAPEAVLRRMMPHTNLFLYDLKLMDRALHREVTGANNEPILQNLALLAREHGVVIVRIPLLAGVNDDDANLAESFTFLSSIKLRRVDLLPYHPTGIEKYNHLGIDYGSRRATAPAPERLEEIASRYREQGFELRIGG